MKVGLNYALKSQHHTLHAVVACADVLYEVLCHRIKVFPLIHFTDELHDVYVLSCIWENGKIKPNVM